MRTSFTTMVLLLHLAQAESSNFDIATKKQEDRVAVTAAAGKTVFDIHSRSGIGAADVTRKQDRWPAAVVVRLHLGGLESFAVTGGTTRLTTSVASHGDHAQRLHVDQHGTDREVERGSPFWTVVTVWGADGKPSRDCPLKDGYFEIALPAALLQDQPQTITLRWIDFYRG